MKFRVAIAALALCSPAFGMSQKQKVSVRFHAEANPSDGASFVMPAKLHNQRRDVSLSRVPAINEKQIKAIYPFPGDDGTWGCVFQLDQQGRIRLETMSSEQLHTALVLFVSTKQGQHQVIDMLIDRPVTTGIITVPRGLTDTEVAVMKTQFTVLGETKGKGKGKPEAKPDDTDWRTDPSRNARPSGAFAPATPGAVAPPSGKPQPAPATKPQPTPTPAERQKLRELDLPRVAD